MPKEELFMPLTPQQVFSVIDQQLNHASPLGSGAPFTMATFSLVVQGPTQAPQLCIFDKDGIPRGYVSDLINLMQDGNGRISYDGQGFHWFENPPITIPTVLNNPFIPQGVSSMTGQKVQTVGLTMQLDQVLDLVQKIAYKLGVV